MDPDLDLRIDEIAEAAVRDVYRRIWLDSPLTATQSRLVWLTVIHKLLTSSCIDAKTDVLKEGLRNNEPTQRD